MFSKEFNSATFVALRLSEINALRFGNRTDVHKLSFRSG